MLGKKHFFKLCVCVFLFVIFSSSSSSSSTVDIENYLKHFDGLEGQRVLTGPVNSFVINQPQLIITLLEGEVSIFSFGLDKPSAMVFKGKGQISFTPPNPIEVYQLNRLTDEEVIEDKFKEATFFFNNETDIIPNKSGLDSLTVEMQHLNSLKDAYDDAFHHLGIYLPNVLLDGLVSDNASNYFYFDIRTKQTGHLVFINDITNADQFRILRLKRSGGARTGEVLTGYSIDDLLPSQRGVQPIDITHYDIESKIESDGGMTSLCRMYYTPLISGKKFLYFDWYSDIEVISITDETGETILPVFRKESFSILGTDIDESGVGLYLGKPTIANEKSYIDFEYKSKCLEKWSTIFIVKTISNWYPNIHFKDPSTFNLTFDTPKKYEVISCGNKVSSEIKDGRRIDKFELNQQSDYVSFNVGSFESKEIVVEGYAPVEMYLAQEIADISGGGQVIIVKDRLGNVGADIMNSLAFFTGILETIKYDTLKVTGIPYSLGQGSPGLVHLWIETFLDEDLDGRHESFRAHEVAHQWWGHVVDNESYRDAWIIEGLATYFGLWFYQASADNKKAYDKMLKEYRHDISFGTGIGSAGIESGPPVMGYRLNSIQNDDYLSQVYYKGAYIFHMIRYILYDYKTESDTRFVTFLQDLIAKFRDKPITTAGLKTVLEQHCGGDMTWFFDQWVYGCYYPKYKIDHKIYPVDGGKTQVQIKIDQQNVPNDFKVLMPITLVFDGGRYQHYKIWVDKPHIEMTFPAMPYKTKKVVFSTYDAILCDGN